ncbi:MAG: hypothetical protein M3N97_04810 [Pseudomonadota bacterium]|nr:hypothetical protein [Pseudomonadota bacterium]
MEPEFYPKSLDAVVRYEERERATRQWCRKAARSNDASPRPATPVLTVGPGLLDKLAGEDEADNDEADRLGADRHSGKLSTFLRR